jgi:hypothetical protein
MATVPQTHQPSPELIFETLNAYQRTAALRGAIELDLFTAIGEGAATAADLAGKLKVPERGARSLSDYLVVAKGIGHSKADFLQRAAASLLVRSSMRARTTELSARALIST